MRINEFSKFVEGKHSVSGDDQQGYKVLLNDVLWKLMPILTGDETKHTDDKRKYFGISAKCLETEKNKWERFLFV